MRNRRLSVSVSGAPRCPQLLLPRRHGCCCCSDCACSSSSLLWTLAPRDRFPPREVAFYLLYQSLRPQKKKKTWGKLFSYSSPFIALLFALCSFVRLALSLSLSLSLCFRLCLTAVFFAFIEFCRRNSFVSFLPFWFAPNRKNLGIAAGSNGLSLVSVAICGVFAVFGEKVTSCSPFFSHYAIFMSLCIPSFRSRNNKVPKISREVLVRVFEV